MTDREEEAESKDDVSGESGKPSGAATEGEPSPTDAPKDQDEQMGASTEVEGGEKPSEEDLEEFRQQVMGEYGSDGLGENTPEGGLTNEELGEQAKAENEREVTKGEVDGVANFESSKDSTSSGVQEGPGTESGEDFGDSRTTPVAARPETGGDIRTDLAKPTREGGEMTVEASAEASPKATAEVYNRNDHQIVVVGQESPEGPKSSPAKVETGGFHHFPSGAQPETESGARTFEAVDYGKGANVRFPKSDLEMAGFDSPDHSAILRLGLRESGSEDVETVFARYNLSDRRAEAYVGGIGGVKGSRYELVEAREVNEDRLAREFERTRCDHLGNVRLEHADGKMALNVDERRIELENHWISTSGSHAVMRGKLDGSDGCKIRFEGRRTSVLFGRDYHVEEMKMHGDDLIIRYAQSKNEKYEHRLHLEHLETPEKPSLNQFDKPQMLEHAKMFERPERIEGTYHFVLDGSLREEIKGLLGRSKDHGERAYGMMKAEISERLVPNMLESTGWERIKWHPFNTTRKDGADAPETDWLVRTPEGEAVLLEIKWFENLRDAVRKGKRQVEGDFQEHRDDTDLHIRGAFIAIVGYDEDGSREGSFFFHILRVSPKEKMK